MQFEDFDKRIREAADHHHPAYDEQAWAKMEQLLNKHMPVKKDRRRGIIFFLLFLGLLLGGASYYYFAGNGRTANKGQEAVNSKQGTSDREQVAGGKEQEAEGREQVAGGKGQEAEGREQVAGGKEQEANSRGQEAGGSTKQTLISNQKLTSSNTNDKNSTIRSAAPEQANTTKVNSNLLKQTYSHAVQDAFNARVNKSRNDRTVSKNKVEPDNVLKGQTAEISGGQQLNNITDNNKMIPDAQVPVFRTNDALNPQQPVQTNHSVTTAQPAVAGAEKPEANKSVAPANKPEVAAAAAAVSAAAKKKAGKSTFFIAASGGPDVSVVGVSNAGTVKLVGGGGLGYTFKGKFTLRTGFYTARKVYTASPEQYHPPSSFWNYYPNLQKVEADCKVYEIPLLFSYNFAKKGNGNWFAGTGISSYLMKRETYNYYYKTNAGVYTSRKYTLLDKNHHYFSVLTLSGGYQRSIGKGFFLSAEPYMKVPLSGIGYGKINLNSAGLLFSAGWTPFHPKKSTPKTH